MRSTCPGCCRIATAGPAAVMVALSLLARPALGQDDDGGQQNAPVATGSGPLVTSIEAETLHVEDLPDGSTTRSWQPATRLSAGDEVYYTIRVRNPGKQEVTSIIVTKRLPFGVHYKRGSAVGPAC